MRAGAPVFKRDMPSLAKKSWIIRVAAIVRSSNYRLCSYLGEFGRSYNLPLFTGGQPAILPPCKGFFLKQTGASRKTSKSRGYRDVGKS
jgi:hypothetical protein